MTAPIKGITDDARDQAIDHNLSAATDEFGVSDGQKAFDARNKVGDQNRRDETRFTDTADDQRRRVTPHAAKLVRPPIEPVQHATTGESFSPNQLAGKIQA